MLSTLDILPYCRHKSATTVIYFEIWIVKKTIFSRVRIKAESTYVNVAQFFFDFLELEDGNTFSLISRNINSEGYLVGVRRAICFAR